MNKHVIFALVVSLATSIHAQEFRTVTDVDGNTYRTFIINRSSHEGITRYEFMAENLKVTHYADGFPINFIGNDTTVWKDDRYGAYSWYDNDIKWKEPYGALYNYYVLKNFRGLCPTGWNIPTYEEWQMLSNHFGHEFIEGGNRFKSCRQVNSPLRGACNTYDHPRWDSHYEYGTDDYGFSGLPAGYRHETGFFGGLGTEAIWWSRTPADWMGTIHGRKLTNSSPFFDYWAPRYNWGVSVRCIRDITNEPYLPVIKLNEVSTIDVNSASLHATIEDWSNAEITEYGFYYAETPGAEAGGQKVTGTLYNNFMHAFIDDLKYSTTYYVKAYAINAAGEALSNELSFKTGDEPIPIKYFTISTETVPPDAGSATGQGTFQENSLIQLNAIPYPHDGYRFVSWTEYDEIIGTGPNIHIVVSRDRHLVAHFVKNVFFVHTHRTPEYGGTVSEGGAYRQQEGVTLTAIPNQYYRFDHWSENGEAVGMENTMQFTVDRERNLTAHFITDTVVLEISVVPPGCGSVSGQGAYALRSRAEVSTQADEGQRFLRWMHNGRQLSVRDYYDFTITGDMQLTAEYAVIPENPGNLSVTANADPAFNGTVLHQGLYHEGDSVCLVAAANEGQAFLMWLEDEQVVLDENQEISKDTLCIKVNSNRHFTARFSDNHYELTTLINVPEAGTIDHDQQGRHQAGAFIWINAHANDGFRFVNWTENGEQVYSLPNIGFTLEQDKTLTANFQPIPEYSLTLEIKPSHTGSITGQQPGLYNKNSWIELKAEPEKGYAFKYWVEDFEILSATPEYHFSMHWDRNLQAIFIPKQFCVVFFVFDAQHQAISDATVRINTTDMEAGIYEIEDLRPGEYDFTVFKNGYLPYRGHFTMQEEGLFIYVYLSEDTTHTGEPASSGITIYPNPGNMLVRINANDPINEIRVFDMLGQLVLSDSPNSTQSDLNIQHLPNGLYVVVVKQENKLINRILQVIH